MLVSISGPHPERWSVEKMGYLGLFRGGVPKAGICGLPPFSCRTATRKDGAPGVLRGRRANLIIAFRRKAGWRLVGLARLLETGRHEELGQFGAGTDELDLHGRQALSAEAKSIGGSVG